MNNKTAEQLRQLIAENPDVPVEIFVATEIVSGDYHRYWRGQLHGAFLTKCVWVDDSLYTLDERWDLVEDWIVSNGDDYPDDTTSESLVSLAEEAVNQYDWKPAIVVFVELPSKQSGLVRDNW